jgi:TfoX/Sxy family transcriptional regulator of competence genes
MPERLYDEPEELAQWAKVALSVAENSKTTKKKQIRKHKPRLSSPASAKRS